MSDFNWDQYVFIDTETTGLHFREHSLLEVTYAVGLNAPVTLYTTADLSNADPVALKVNKYLERFAGDGEIGEWIAVPREFCADFDHLSCNLYGHKAWLALPQEASQDEWNEFAAAIKGKTWVGANPRFDVNFIEEFFWPERLEYHYHLFDIRSWWKGVNSSIDMVSKEPRFEPISEQARTFIEKHFVASPTFVEPDHSSEQDVRSMRQAFIYNAWLFDKANLIKLDTITDAMMVVFDSNSEGF